MLFNFRNFNLRIPSRPLLYCSECSAALLLCSLYSIADFTSDSPAYSQEAATMPTAEGGPRTLYDKVFQDHIVDERLDGTILLYIGTYTVVIPLNSC